MTRTRRSVVGWVIIGLVPLLIVAVIIGLNVGLRPEQAWRADPGDGLGDPYFPDAGGAGYDAVRYDIAVAWDEQRRQLTGTTVMELVALRDLSTFHVDLDLTIDRVTVNGAAATAVEGRATDRAVRIGRLVRAGERLTAEFSYHGSPFRLRTYDGGKAAFQKGREVVLSGEPEVAAAWFPSNDHPSDPALMEVRATVPADLQAFSTGLLISRDEDADPATATWHWRNDEPTVTYASLLAIGDFEVRTGTAGRPYAYAVSKQLTPQQRTRAWEGLMATPKRIEELEQLYGPYPVGAMGGVVTAAELPFAGMESLGRPLYNDTICDPGDWPRILVTHEQAHMWFGNRAWLKTWDDIVMNEGFATHAQWLVEEKFHQEDADEQLRGYWEQGPRFWRRSIADPGHRNLFGTTYTRGAMALEALRNVIGADAFDALARAWASEPAARSLEDFQALAQQRTERDLTDFWRAWYSAEQAPPKTADYGWPGDA